MEFPQYLSDLANRQNDKGDYLSDYFYLGKALSLLDKKSFEYFEKVVFKEDK
jgi:hypothetical protein